MPGQKIDEGQMDMVLDFTNPVPAIWTMKLMGLPPTKWRHWAEYFHAATVYGQQMPEYQAAVVRTPEMVAEVTEVLGSVVAIPATTSSRAWSRWRSRAAG